MLTHGLRVEDPRCLRARKALHSCFMVSYSMCTIVHMYVCMHACRFIRVYTYIYIYINT